MFGSTILEVAIGIVFVYLLLSLICSALSELIEARLRLRAKDLKKGILTLFGDPKKQGLLAKDFFDHPLIKAMGDQPSYIPSRTFSLALWNLASKAGAAGEATIGLTRNLPQIRKTIESFPDDKVRQALLMLIDEAGGDFDRARENVERWYDDVMDRVSGWYKRRTQWILLAIGLSFAVVLNIDSLKIADQLYRDGPQRSAIVSTAEGYAAASKDSDTVAKAGIKENFDRIKGLGFPLGWTRTEFPAETDLWAWICALVLKAVGLLATGMAVSLGAPFWFDVLNKFMVVRSTIKPREKSQVTPSKDKKAETESEPDDKNKDKDKGEKT